MLAFASTLFTSDVIWVIQTFTSASVGVLSDESSIFIPNGRTPRTESMSVKLANDFLVAPLTRHVARTQRHDGVQDGLAIRPHVERQVVVARLRVMLQDDLGQAFRNPLTRFPVLEFMGTMQ